MRYARDHTRNGVKHAKGDKYTGPTHSGRFLYHRGILEPDGDPQDADITRPARAAQAWNVTVQEPPSDSTTLTWNPGGEEQETDNGNQE